MFVILCAFILCTYSTLRFNSSRRRINNNKILCACCYHYCFCYNYYSASFSVDTKVLYCYRIYIYMYIILCIPIVKRSLDIIVKKTNDSGGDGKVYADVGGRHARIGAYQR